tara:strand:- start:1498 stop:2427 length:930 start_codon:yes stop_codon:yes gene_type:complete
MMLKLLQHTLSKSVAISGIGLHTGLKSNIVIKPAKEDQGIVFVRTDIKKNNKIKANYKNVSSAKLCTTLENESGVKVSTVEHLLAALYIYDIDNAVIEIDTEEVPILDGSAKDFLNELVNVDLKTQNKKRRYLKIERQVDLDDNGKTISIEPSNLSFNVEFKLNYDNKIIGRQKNSVNFNLDNLKDIYSSRTFCLFEDIKKIKKIGLAKGGSLENAIVVEKNKVLNDGGLRNKNEFVNHKILDLVGDFVLSGFRVLGKVKCYQGGHKLTNSFLRKLIKNKNAYSVKEIKDIQIPKKINSNQSLKIAVNA